MEKVDWVLQFLMAILVTAGLIGCGGIAQGEGSDPFPETATDEVGFLADSSDEGVESGEPDLGTIGPTPLGLPMSSDGVTRIGVAEVDITPLVAETYFDLNQNNEFDGCPDDPDALLEGCDEPFDDANGNGEFDAVWIAGFDPKRAASGVHDPITVRSMVVVRNGEYVVLTGIDLIGLLSFRIDAARAVLVDEDGMEPHRWIAASAHNHQGPDCFGIWGFTDLDTFTFTPGFDPEYQEFLVHAMVQSVREAADRVQPVEVLMGMTDLAGASAWFNGERFGGLNPRPHTRGLIHDIRDPVLASTGVFLMHARDPDTLEGVASLLNFSGHPEVWGDENTLISSDWVGVARDRIDSALGGLTVFLPESVGGMQSMLGAEIPLVDESGEWVWQRGIPGEPIPVWAEKETWEYVRSVGVHVADAALAALEGALVVTLDPIEVRWQPMRVHADNDGWALGAVMGIGDFDLDGIIKDPELCPGFDPGDPFDVGCMDTWTWRLRLGPLAAITAPGELLPELFHGFPDDPVWAAESKDPSLRGVDRGSRYFPQHPAACDGVDFDDCRAVFERDGCDCLKMHDVPYVLSSDPVLAVPMKDRLDAAAPFKLAISMTGNYLSYIIPANDFNTAVSVLEGPVGDHYEDSVAASSTHATVLQQAQLVLSQ